MNSKTIQFSSRRVRSQSCEFSSSPNNASIGVAVLGSAGAGKTSLINRSLSHENVLMCKQPVDGFFIAMYHGQRKRVKLDIIDHSSSHRLPPLQYPGIARCNVFILVHEIGDEASFNHAADLREQIIKSRENQPPPLIIAVGNKSDITSIDIRQSRVTAELVASCDWGLQYLETSATTDSNVHALLDRIIEMYLKSCYTTRPTKFAYLRQMSTPVSSSHNRQSTGTSQKITDCNVLCSLVTNKKRFSFIKNEKVKRRFRSEMTRSSTLTNILANMTSTEQCPIQGNNK